MNRHRRVIVVALCAALPLLSSGCGDKVAEELAQQLVTVTNSYQEQIDRTNEAERKAYKTLAAIYVEAQRNDVLQSLEQERIERAGKLADETTDAKQTPPTLSEIQSQLRDYANFDFENTRRLMKDESEARAQYLAQLAKLSNDSAKVEALSKAFANLAKSKSKVQQVKELAAFFEETKKGVDKLLCEDLTAKIDSLQKSIDAKKNPPAAGETPEEKAKRMTAVEGLRAEVDALKKQKEAKKCA